MREGVVRLADGRGLGYGEYGVPDGVPILHFHGLPGGRFYDLDHSVLEAEGARMLTVERPGIGLSDRCAGRTLTDWPADVAGFADALGLDRFAVLGTSAGAPFAFATAALLGDRVTACALRCGLGPAFAHPEFDDQLVEIARPLMPIARADRDAASEIVHAVLGEDAKRWRADPEAFFAEWVVSWPENDRAAYVRDRALWERVLEATHRTEGGFADDAICTYGPWDFDLAAVHTPVRAFHGTADHNAPLALIEIAVKEAGGDVVRYEGEGHYLEPRHDIDTVRFCVRP